MKLNGDSVQDCLFIIIAFSDSKASSAHKRSQHNHILNLENQESIESNETQES